METCDACNGAGGDNRHGICGKCDGAGGYPMTDRPGGGEDREETLIRIVRWCQRRMEPSYGPYVDLMLDELGIDRALTKATDTETE